MATINQESRAAMIRELFYFFSLLLAVSVVLEIIWPNIILAYFNLNYLVVACLASGSAALYIGRS